MDCFKGYSNLFKDLSIPFGYKTTPPESSYLLKYNYCFLLNWFVCICFRFFRFSHHGRRFIHFCHTRSPPTYIHTFQSIIHTRHGHLFAFTHTLLIWPSSHRLPEHEAAYFDLFHWCVILAKILQCLDIVAYV